MGQSERAAYFRQLHTNRPLVLPNAWDAASARVIELAGALAIASTSAGVSWSYGRGDGQKLRREEMIQAIRYMVQTVAVPVTADIESGYGSGSAHDVAETVRAVIAIGAVGINLEDSPGRDGEVLLPPDVHAERIRAARGAALAAGGDLVINARTDVYLFQVGAQETRFDAAVQRANLYRAAGADCLFVPGVIDADTIAALVRAIDGPLNIMAMPGAPSASQLGQLGVARVSVGPAISPKRVPMARLTVPRARRRVSSAAAAVRVADYHVAGPASPRSSVTVCVATAPIAAGAWRGSDQRPLTMANHDFNTTIVEEVAHRPWTMPDRRWVMTQTWHDLLFAHWPVDRSQLRSKVPAAFELDLFDDDAWIGIVPFHMTNVAPRGVPSLPWVSEFPELNVRTYVRVGDRAGIYFFSLDAGSALAVQAARTLLNLPYHSASMAVSRTATGVEYRSARRSDPMARFTATYEPIGSAFVAPEGSLDYFLTERYCLYHLDHRGAPYRLEIHHPPWPLQRAEAQVVRNTMAEVNGVRLPDQPPLLHFAKRQDMIAWPPSALR